MSSFYLGTDSFKIDYKNVQMDISFKDMVHLYEISIINSGSGEPFYVLVFEGGYLVLNIKASRKFAKEIDLNKYSGNFSKLKCETTPMGWRRFPFLAHHLKTRKFNDRVGRKRLSVFIKKISPPQL